MWKDDACLLEMLQAARDATSFLEGRDKAGFNEDRVLRHAIMMKWRRGSDPIGFPAGSLMGTLVNAIKLSVNPEILCTCDQFRLGI